jgi:hypothetical protein
MCGLTACPMMRSIHKQDKTNVVRLEKTEPAGSCEFEVSPFKVLNLISPLSFVSLFLSFF